MSTRPTKNLETFPNPQPNRDYLIHIEIPEFTSLCPLTGQPDFATLLLDYIPDQKNVELKALKLYMWSYRQEGAFHEAITNYMRLKAKWWVRGGIYTTVVVEHRKEGWVPVAPVELPEFETNDPTRG